MTELQHDPTDEELKQWKCDWDGLRDLQFQHWKERVPRAERWKIYRQIQENYRKYQLVQLRKYHNEFDERMRKKADSNGLVEINWKLSWREKSAIYCPTRPCACTNTWWLCPWRVHVYGEDQSLAFRR